MMQRLICNWVYGGFWAALLLLVLAPLLIPHWPAALIATFLLLPAYMVHQLEEHDGDRFRLFFNETLGKGYDVLSHLAVFVINVPGVWGAVTLSLYTAACVHLGWALIAVGLVLVNAAVHIVHGVVFRRYNPGLVTAIVLFLPLGGYTLMLVQHAGGGSLFYYTAGFAIAILIHVAIVAHARRRLARLQSALDQER